METVQTPDERFADLPDFDFQPNYAEIADGEDGMLRIHYLDEGPANAAAILLLHGEPSWSFLYRHVIPPLVAAGHRVIVPDQVGFGRSDKPVETSAYTYARHVEWMSSLVFDALGLRDMTFFGQDWGGLIGLRLVAARPECFARVVIANTGLPTGDGPLSDAFMDWQEFSKTSPGFPIGNIVNGGCSTDLAADVIRAYDAPFPDDRHKAGARIWPSLVPTGPDDPESEANRAAWRQLARFDKPFLCCFSDEDPVTRGGAKAFLDNVPGTRGQAHTTIAGGGHFVQEDRGPELAAVINDFIAATTRP